MLCCVVLRRKAGKCFPCVAREREQNRTICIPSVSANTELACVASQVFQKCFSGLVLRITSGKTRQNGRTLHCRHDDSEELCCDLLGQEAQEKQSRLDKFCVAGEIEA